MLNCHPVEALDDSNTMSVKKVELNGYKEACE